MTAVEAPYKWTEPYDDFLKNLILSAKKDMEAVNDDRLYITVGPTGSGKSMLSFHIIHLFAGDKLSLDHLAGTRESFARKVKDATDRFQFGGERGLPLWFDEADSDNMEQNAKWNKKLFSLYMKIRFLQFFHIWCWPSLKAVDKRFVEERVNGIFFCYTKEKDKPRLYAYFSKKSIIKLLEDDISLNYHNMRKYKDTHAAWIGRFRDYEGPFKKEYIESKHQSGFDTVNDFYEQFANVSGEVKAKTLPQDEVKQKYIREPVLSQSKMAAVFNMSVDTLRLRKYRAIEQGIVEDKETYTREEWEQISQVKTSKSFITIKKYVQTNPDASLLVATGGNGTPSN